MIFLSQQKWSLTNRVYILSQLPDNYEHSLSTLLYCSCYVIVTFWVVFLSGIELVEVFFIAYLYLHCS